MKRRGVVTYPALFHDIADHAGQFRWDNAKYAPDNPNTKRTDDQKRDDFILGALGELIFDYVLFLNGVDYESQNVFCTDGWDPSPDFLMKSGHTIEVKAIRHHHKFLQVRKSDAKKHPNYFAFVQPIKHKCTAKWWIYSCADVQKWPVSPGQFSPNYQIRIPEQITVPA